MISLKNTLLIATPILQDGIFDKSLIYICEHNEEGTLGVIVNKTTSLSYGDIMEQIGIQGFDQSLFNQASFFGGPVDIDHGFVLHHKTDKTWQASMDTGNELILTSSKDILDSIANQQFDQKYLIGLGYAGWYQGQLEKEISENAWLTCEADEDIIFDTKNEEKLKKTCEKIGIDWSNLSSNIGHA